MLSTHCVTRTKSNKIEKSFINFFYTNTSAFVFFTQIVFWNFKSSIFWKGKKKSLLELLHIKTNIFYVLVLFLLLCLFNESQAFFNTT